MKAELILALIALLAWRSAWAQQGCSDTTAVLADIMGHYQKSRVPGGRVQVESEIWIQNIRSVNELRGTVDMEIYLSQMWLDPALSHDHMMPCRRNISLGHQFFGRIWQPNTVFIDSVRADIALSPTPNLFVMLYPNGSVWTNERLLITAPCSMDHSRYPHDKQQCSLTFESFTHNADAVDMRWTESGVAVMQNLHMADFTLTRIETARAEVEYPAGRWIEMTFSVKLMRRWGWYMTHHYLPAMLTVLVSWGQLCLGPNALAARAVVAVGSFLQIILLAAYGMCNAPKVSYIRSLDVFNAISVLFIVANVIELAIVGMCVGWSPANVVPSQCGQDVQHKHANWAKRTKCIDILCLLAFALLYLIAIVLYFAL